MKILIVAAIALLLNLGNADTAKAGPVGECVEGAVTTSLGGWVLAIILAPATGGASLATMASVDMVVATAAAGCIVGVGGKAAAKAADRTHK